MVKRWCKNFISNHCALISFENQINISFFIHSLDAVLWLRNVQWVKNGAYLVEWFTYWFYLISDSVLHTQPLHNAIHDNMTFDWNQHVQTEVTLAKIESFRWIRSGCECQIEVTCRKTKSHFQYNIITHPSGDPLWMLNKHWANLSHFFKNKNHIHEHCERRIFNLKTSCETKWQIFDLSRIQTYVNTDNFIVCLGTWSQWIIQNFYLVFLLTTLMNYIRVFIISKGIVFCSYSDKQQYLAINSSEYWHCSLKLMIQWLRKTIIIDIQRS